MTSITTNRHPPSGKTLSRRLTALAGQARRFLDRGSRREIVRFIKARQNPDGGFRGRGAESDLYYTVFAVAGLKALGASIPVWSLWRHVCSQGDGDRLDLVHLVCLVRLRLAFPMRRKTRHRLLQKLDRHRAESAYGLFLKLFAEDGLRKPDLPAEKIVPLLYDHTPNLAAFLVVNRQPDAAVEKELLNRFHPSGGFSATAQRCEPDLLSTATALFALVEMGVDLDAIRRPCLDYVQSLWRDSGGFAGHAADGFEDVEYTFYALLSIGCLMDE